MYTTPQIPPHLAYQIVGDDIFLYCLELSKQQNISSVEPLMARRERVVNKLQQLQSFQQSLDLAATASLVEAYVNCENL